MDPMYVFLIVIIILFSDNFIKNHDFGVSFTAKDENNKPVKVKLWW